MHLKIFTTSLREQNTRNILWLSATIPFVGFPNAIVEMRTHTCTCTKLSQHHLRIFDDFEIPLETRRPLWFKYNLFTVMLSIALVRKGRIRRENWLHTKFFVEGRECPNKAMPPVKSIVFGPFHLLSVNLLRSLTIAYKILVDVQTFCFTRVVKAEIHFVCYCFNCICNFLMLY